MNVNVFIMQCIKPTYFLFPENTNDLGLLLLRSRILVVCAAVRTLLFITYENLVCVHLQMTKVRSSSQVGCWRLSGCMSGRVLQACQSDPLLPLFTFIAHQNHQPVGMYRGCEAKNTQCFEVTCCLAGSSFPVFMLQLLSLQQCFPCYALTACRRAKFTLAQFCYLQ